jgi:hypothetical protein
MKSFRHLAQVEWARCIVRCEASSISVVSAQEKGQELVLGKPAPLFVVHPLAPRLGVLDTTPDAQKFMVFGDTGSLSRVPLSVTMNGDADLAKKQPQ